MGIKITISDLKSFGFSFGTFAGSKKLIPHTYYDNSASIEYRNPNGDKISDNQECDEKGFSICNYGSSSYISVPIKIKSIEDLENFCNFF